MVSIVESIDLEIKYLQKPGKSRGRGCQKK
jgi:hypothetical protein